MGRTSKWVEVTSGSQPAAKVARRALADRLQLVWRYLRRSTEGSPGDIENVHQLRVGTRRAMAVLTTFADWLPSQRYRWMQRQLKRIRKTAGNARDLDVMIVRFTPLAHQESNLGPYQALVHRLQVRRKRAQDPIDALYEKLQRKDFSRRMAELSRRVRPRGKARRGGTTFADVAGQSLLPLVKQYFEAAAADFHDYTQLHALRILGKQLRYSMEIFSGAFPPAFRQELYPQVADLQERLGTINDHATAREQFSAWLQEAATDAELCSLLESLIAEECEQLEQCRAVFSHWFTADRRVALERQFQQLLGITPAEPESKLVLRQAE